ncbi:DUF427 domain-containing protein [Candidatus Saccharibacteria bacterium]|nr:DUF427 domain-containing protein [Candidatus Saccharibacteria bacterium]
MKATWNGQVIAETDKEDLIYIEGNWYFPGSSIKDEYSSESDTPYTCPWKGECQYYDVTVDGKVGKDVAFRYPHPLPTAIERVKKDFSNHYAFWNGVEVSE